MKLFLFTTEVGLATEAQEAGIDSVIVDWENKEKFDRQKNHVMETNSDTLEDVKNLSSCLKIPVSVRINKMGDYTADEVGSALDNGAKKFILPMARTVAEVEKFLSIVKGRAETIVQIETYDLAGAAAEMALLPWDYAYIGLNDLMIDRGGKNIWEAVLDGTVEKICEKLKGRAYGFGGITVLGGGSPISFELILHELTRLNCRLSFLRRTFKKELMDRDIKAEVQAIRGLILSSSLRGPQAKLFDRQRLCQAIQTIL